MTMTPTTIKSPIEIEIKFDNIDDLNTLLENREFNQFIIENVFSLIKYAIENNLPSIELFKIMNLSYTIEVDKKQFKRILNKIVKYFEESENYDMCSQILSLIKKL